ncbi:MAG: four helix bundle protein [Patescibacteria group bacterium]
MTTKSYRDLIVWQKSLNLVLATYELTKCFPKEELFGLTTQIRRAAISIPSNIAEGYGRRSNGDFRRFLLIAKGSALELETQLLIAKELKLTEDNKFTKAESLLIEVAKLLYCFVKKIK